ncbi:MAG TPA: HEAT repeat domain-containing protein, partial [Vicinamibacteria bacterium]|nr:HEAT repeat domain-containing protein [Vicinamibacteria bacterium]
REIAADLTDPALQPSQMNPAFEALKQIGPLAAGVADVLVARLHAQDDGSAYTRTAYFCEVTRTMAKVAPRDPAVIRALANALAQSRGGGDSHRNGCALDALREAGPAAAEVAGPVLRQIARAHVMTTYADQLSKAIEAIGVGGAMVASLVGRATDDQVGIDDRAAALRTLGKSYADMNVNDQGEVRAAAARLLDDPYPPVRQAAAEALGPAGPAALEALTHGLADARYEVRAAAARSLAQLGPAAAGARRPLLAALDPFLGTAEAAAEALVAIGPAALPDAEAHARSAPRPLRPLAEATARAIQGRNMAPVQQVLRDAYGHGPGVVGYSDVEVTRTGGGLAYAPNGHRIKARFRGGPYSPSGTVVPSVEGTLTVDNAPNSFFAALVGRRAGDRVKVLLSPEMSPDPYWAVQTVGRPPTHLPVATGASFDVEVLRVCEPVIWTVFRGSGIWGPIRFELYCR